MEQKEILDLAMWGVLRLMDNTTDGEEHKILSEKLKELAMLFVLEDNKTPRQE